MAQSNTPPASKANFSDFEQDIIQGLLSGKPLAGKDGVLADLIGFVAEKVMDAELGDHLRQEVESLDEARQERNKNKRNGKAPKTLTTEFGPTTISPSRDRNGTFESTLVPKWQRGLSHNLDQQILSLYARGSSYQDISDHLHELFGHKLSKASISSIVDEVWPRVLEFQQRPLESFYVAIFMDAIHFKVRLEGQSANVAVYLFYGVDKLGNRDILTLHVSNGAEGASTWSVLTEELKERGVEDVLVFVSDGLSGTREVLEHHFPKSDQQRCIVHKIRNSMLGIPYKDRKAVAKGLRTIYTAIDEPAALLALEDFEAAWPKYPHVGRTWRKDWSELMSFMKYGPDLRRLIYTTNALENVNRQLRRATKSKGSWTNNRSLTIQLFLVIDATRKSWGKQVFKFAAVQRELIEAHGQRYLKWLEN